MATSGPTELPIFELPLAIVPSEQVPLHIFEERYKRMIDHCLESGSPFGVIFSDDDGARAIGCSAEVSDVVERYEDGRLDVIVRGERPFRVLDRFEAPDWPAGKVEMITAETDDGPAGEELERAREAFRALLAAVGAEPERAEAAEGAFPIAAQVELPGDEKQRLLEAGDERSRLLSLAGSLRELIGRLRRSRELAELARSNGHGPVPGSDG